MLEIRKALIQGKVDRTYYPKYLDTYKGRDYNEYRFYCAKCKKEWVYNALFREFTKVPYDSQFKYDPKKRLLIPNPKAAATHTHVSVKVGEYTQQTL